MPAFNSARFISRAIESVRAQSVEVVEILVVDDASTDDTAEVARALGARVIPMLHNGGPGASRNAGIEAATTEWIATLDADDTWHPRKLELQYAALELEPKIGLIFSDFDAVSLEDGRIHRPNIVLDDASFVKIARRPLTDVVDLLDFDAFMAELPSRSIILPSTALFRRSLALAVGGFSTTVKAEDTEFFLRLTAATQTAFVHVPLLAYMRHYSQITANWELDPVRMALYHHVMVRRASYHPLQIRGYRRQYTKLLYFIGANALQNRRYVDAARSFLKAFAVAITRGALPILYGVVTKSAAFGALRKRVPFSKSGRSQAGNRVETIPSSLYGIAIPWRGVAGA